MRDTLAETFILANCDTIVDIEFADLVDYHRNSGNEITIVASNASAGGWPKAALRTVTRRASGRAGRGWSRGAGASSPWPPCW